MDKCTRNTTIRTYGSKSSRVYRTSCMYECSVDPDVLFDELLCGREKQVVHTIDPEKVCQHGETVRVNRITTSCGDKKMTSKKKKIKKKRHRSKGVCNSSEESNTKAKAAYKPKRRLKRKTDLFSLLRKKIDLKRDSDFNKSEVSDFDKSEVFLFDKSEIFDLNKSNHLFFPVSTSSPMKQFVPTNTPLLIPTELSPISDTVPGFADGESVVKMDVPTSRSLLFSTKLSPMRDTVLGFADKEFIVQVNDVHVNAADRMEQNNQCRSGLLQKTCNNPIETSAAEIIANDHLLDVNTAENINGNDDKASSRIDDENELSRAHGYLDESSIIPADESIISLTDRMLEVSNKNSSLIKEETRDWVLLDEAVTEMRKLSIQSVYDGKSSASESDENLSIDKLSSGTSNSIDCCASVCSITITGKKCNSLLLSATVSSDNRCQSSTSYGESVIDYDNSGGVLITQNNLHVKKCNTRDESNIFDNNASDRDITCIVDSFESVNDGDDDDTSLSCDLNTACNGSFGKTRKHYYNNCDFNSGDSYTNEDMETHLNGNNIEEVADYEEIDDSLADGETKFTTVIMSESERTAEGYETDDATMANDNIKTLRHTNNNRDSGDRSTTLLYLTCSNNTNEDDRSNIEEVDDDEEVGSFPREETIASANVEFVKGDNNSSVINVDNTQRYNIRDSNGGDCSKRTLKYWNTSNLNDKAEIRNGEINSFADEETFATTILSVVNVEENAEENTTDNSTAIYSSDETLINRTTRVVSIVAGDNKSTVLSGEFKGFEIIDATRIVKSSSKVKNPSEVKTDIIMCDEISYPESSPICSDDDSSSSTTVKSKGVVQKFSSDTSFDSSKFKNSQKKINVPDDTFFTEDAIFPPLSPPRPSSDVSDKNKYDRNTNTDDTENDDNNRVKQLIFPLPIAANVNRVPLRTKVNGFDNSSMTSNNNNNTLSVDENSKFRNCLTINNSSTAINGAYLHLPAGKKWRRTMTVFKALRDGSINFLDETMNKGRNWRKVVEELVESQQGDSLIGEYSTMVVRQTNSWFNDKSQTSYLWNHNTIPSNTMHISFEDADVEQILLRNCNQEELLPFNKCFQRNNCSWKKIGEGVYGEVFSIDTPKGRTVMKVIPIEGKQMVNDCVQKRFDEILSEIIISAELNNLRNRRDYFTDSYCQLIKCWYIRGKYPSLLCQLWDEYDEEHGSENDNPTMFKNDQLYIALELNDGGVDLETFEFTSAQQALSVFRQVSLALAVAEEALHFEHRDLHWGNILVSRTSKREAKYHIKRNKYMVKLHSVKATIIDFTLSRISYHDRVICNNLEMDPDLFTAEGDFQFEVYRLMRQEVEGNWYKFVPKTNIHWMVYLLDKLISDVKYKRTSTRFHQQSLYTMQRLREIVPQLESCRSLINSDEFNS